MVQGSATYHRSGRLIKIDDVHGQPRKVIKFIQLYKAFIISYVYSVFPNVSHVFFDNFLHLMPAYAPKIKWVGGHSI